MLKKGLLKKIVELVVKFFNIYVIYSSVLAIILFPMLFLSGVFIFLLFFYEISWILADPLIIGEVIYSSWLNTYLYNCPFVYSNTFDFIKILIFLVGLIIFLISLGNLAYGLRKRQGIVHFGFYKYIRHPQNLSIIIMAFPFFILQGIRIGDLITWIQFMFLIIIYSDLGDIGLKKKFPEEFQEHYENTGFMFPKLLPYKLTKYVSVFRNKLLRYLIMLFLYILIVRLFYLLYIIFPFYHLYI
ncbi:MAG: hypothetical protein ACW99E_22460 [Promethearchaeota archaeon]|jgi:hypothetical protein